jgi:hypothetical protein
MQVEQWQACRARLLAADDRAELAHEFRQQSTKALLACIWANIADNTVHHPDRTRIARLCAHRREL